MPCALSCSSMSKKANANVSRAESVRKFEILDEEFNQQDGTLTASLKVVTGNDDYSLVLIQTAGNVTDEMFRQSKIP